MTLRVLVAAALSAVAAGAGAAALPSSAAAVAAGWVVFVLAWTGTELWAQARASGHRPGFRFDSMLLRTAETHERPEDLKRCERIFGWRVYSPRDFDHLVRPALADLVRQRLQGPAGAPIDSELDALVGPVPAEQLYPRGVSTRDLSRLVSRIEAL